MIQEFKIKNYKSFRDEVTLSFEATKDTTFENTWWKLPMVCDCYV